MENDMENDILNLFKGKIGAFLSNFIIAGEI